MLTVWRHALILHEANRGVVQKLMQCEVCIQAITLKLLTVITRPCTGVPTYLFKVVELKCFVADHFCRYIWRGV